MNDIQLNLTDKKTQIIIWTLLLLTPIVGMAVDLIAPSLPSMAKSLNTSPKLVKDVISIYLFGYAFGNFLTGILTDSLGRQKLLRLGLVCFIAASIIPIFFPQIHMVLLARLIQGLTIGAIAVVSRTIYSDLLPPEKLVKMGVLIGSLFGLGPVIGPLIGGYLQVYFGWQACFTFFAIIVFILSIAVFLFVPETHLNRHPLNINIVRQNLIEVIKHKQFMALVILMGSVYSLIITFNTVGPFLIQATLKYSPIFFGHLALWMGISFLTATFVCRYLLKRQSVKFLFFIFINLFFVVAAIALILSYALPNNIILIAMDSAIMFFACGFIFPMSMGKGLSLFRHIAGTATALMYLINIIMTSLCSFILSFISINNASALFYIYIILLGICMLVYWQLLHNKE